jgi:hypothetical protein
MQIIKSAFTMSHIIDHSVPFYLPSNLGEGKSNVRDGTFRTYGVTGAAADTSAAALAQRLINLAHLPLVVKLNGICP